MTTAPPPIRTLHAPGPRPGPAGHAPAGSGASALDPMKLLKQYYPYLILALMIGTGLGVAVHFVWLNARPEYTATVLFECLPPLDKPGEATRREMGRDDQERYVGTQVALMQSRIIKESAMDQREIRQTTWAQPFLDKSNNAIDKTEALRQLDKDLSARAIPQSNLVQLSMTTKGSHDPKDCMIIVNAVASAYIGDQRKRTGSASGEQIKVLNDRLLKLEDVVKQLKLDREQVLKDAKMDADTMSQLGDSIAYQNNQKMLDDAQTQLRAVQSQQDEYRQRLAMGQTEHYPDDLKDDAVHDPVIQQYEQKLASLRDLYGSYRKQGFGDRHPDVQAVKAQIDEAEVGRQDYYNDVLKRLWSAQKAKIDSALAMLSSQQKAYEDNQAQLSSRRQELLQAKVRFDTIESDIKLNTEELAKTRAAKAELELLNNRSTETAQAIGDRVRVISDGVIPKGQSWPKIQFVVPGVAFLFTGMVGGFLFLREILDQRVRGPSDAAMVPRVKVLGIVPDAAEDPSRPTSIETVFRDNPTGVLTESFRQMRAPLIQAMERSAHKSLVVVGCMPGSGSTTVVANLALAVAGADEKVLVLDANFRRPSLQRVFKLSDGPGLADVLAGTTALDQAIQPTAYDNLSVLGAGTVAARATPERLAGEAMSRLLLEASSRYDIILVDVPPAVVSGDGYAIANKCDASIIVCRAMNEKRGLLARVRNQIGESRAEFLGVVVNAVRASAGGYFKRNIRATHQYQANGKA